MIYLELLHPASHIPYFLDYKPGFIYKPALNIGRGAEKIEVIKAGLEYKPGLWAGPNIV